MMGKFSSAAIMVSVVALAGCSGGDGTASANAVAPANASGAAPANGALALNQSGNQAATAGDISGARALLDRIYARFRPGTGPPSREPFTPELLAAIRRNSGMPDGGLDHDPFCGCQDFDATFSHRIESVTPTADGALARVAISNMGDSRVIVIRLVNRNGTWLVADVGEGEDSLSRTG